MGKTVRKNFQMAFLSCIYEIHILAVRKLGMIVGWLLRVCGLWSSFCFSEDCPLREQSGLQILAGKSMKTLKMQSNIYRIIES